MRKVIKLTESQLKRIIQKTVNEQKESYEYDLRKMEIDGEFAQISANIDDMIRSVRKDLRRGTISHEEYNDIMMHINDKLSELRSEIE
jgi:hypothetical protein